MMLINIYIYNCQVPFKCTSKLKHSISLLTKYIFMHANMIRQFAIQLHNITKGLFYVSVLLNFVGSHDILQSNSFVLTSNLAI